MLYTTEEAAVICGFLNAHLAQAGVEVSVRKRNAAFQRGVIMGTLQPDDYRWAENVLCFLKPCWWQLHEDYRALENALLKTHLLCVFHFCLFCLFACTMGNTEVRKSGFIIGHTRYTFYFLQFCVVIRSFNNRF